MAEMYVDVEVAYLDSTATDLLRKGSKGVQPRPENCKIITFQYQFLNPDGSARGDLQILKEWKSSEEEIIKKATSLISPHTVWDIIPVGQNISFDLGMIRGRAEKYGIHYDEWFMYNDLPVIDIKSILLGMNAFQFKGSGLDQFTGKESSGIHVPIWYADKEFEKILEYIRKETSEFVKFYSQLKKTLPEFRKQHHFFSKNHKKDL